MKTEVLAEKRQHVILESFGYLARVSSWIRFEAVLDSVGVQNTMQLASVNLQIVLIPDIDRDGAVHP